MAENRIKYYDRNYDEFRNDIIDLTRSQYKNIFDSLDDATIGNWLITMVSDVADTLSNAIDNKYQETNIETAQQISSLKNIAKNVGVNLPGRKAAIVEVEISCKIPILDNVNISMADENYAPIIRRGALFSTGSQTFELMEDVDFKSQFDSNGISNRKIVTIRSANGEIVAYKYSKLAIAYAGQSKILKRTITNKDIEPFFSVDIPDTNILNVESIILKQGTNITTDPHITEFYVDRESYQDRNGRPTLRYFEVENLIDQYRFGHDEQNAEFEDINGVKHLKNYYQPIWDSPDVYEINGEIEPARLVMKGKWKRLKNKFITEFKNDGSLKVTFGAGIRNQYGEIPSSPSMFLQYLMSSMSANDSMGVLPEPNTTMYILYRIGGGEATNIASNTLTNIVYMQTNIDGNCDNVNNSKFIAMVKGSITVTNPSPSYGGKDAPSIEEIRYMLKYAVASQNRCVTLHDYYARLMMIEPKYGLPFRFGVVEENNKVVIYTLGLDYMGKLFPILSEEVANNMKEYLSMYRCINDLIEIRPGRIINLSFEVNVFVDKMYDKSEVSKRIIEMVKDYMDIRAHQMGEDIFLGDLEKEISKLDGVVNLISLKCFNKVGDGYSESQITQQLNPNDVDGDQDNEIDLLSSDKVLLGDTGSMFEIKYIENDIVVNVKER